jgi:di/tricarboxylate transporter/CRP-like cAMP-binding protein
VTSSQDEHAAELAEQEQLLRSIPYLRDLSKVDIARLIGASEDVHFAPETVIVREGETADSLYLLARGEVEITVLVDGAERSVRALAAPATFGEFGLLLAQRTATVRSMTEGQAWRIPRDRFERLVGERPGLGLAMARALATTIDSRERERIGAPHARPAAVRSMSPPAPRRSRLARAASIAIAIAVPAALWLVAPPAGLSPSGWHIALILVGGAIAWLLEPVPDFAVALGVAAAWGATGLASPAHAFGGFATSAWVVVVAALALTAAMASSGLLFRTALMFMRLFPPTHRGQVAALVLGGAVVTPLVPAVFGRVATMAPIAREISQALGHAPRSRGSAAIAFAGVLGNTVLGPIFLSGIVTNFLILGLLPQNEAARFGWLGWLAAAAPAGIVLLLGSVITAIALDPHSASHASRAVRSAQERTLGRLSRNETVSLAALGVFVVGLIMQQLFRVDIGVIGLLAILVAVGGGALDRQSFRAGIDWATVVLFGVLVGVGDVLRSGGVDHWIANLITPMTGATGNPELAIALLALFGVALRLVLPMVPAGFLLLVTLVPAAPQLGLSGWVVGLVCSVVAFTWLLPRQYEVLRMVREATDGELFTDRQAIAVGAAMTGVALVAIAVSVPYWRAIGIL